MCGRFLLHTPTHLLQRAFGFREMPNLEPRYNVAPTQPIAIVRLGASGDRALAQVRWGLVPLWADSLKIGVKAINAGGEGIAQKPMFRGSFKRRRCLVLADGFYEWRRLNGTNSKQPYVICLRTRAPFAFAGLWESWRGPEGEVQTATIITTTPNELMAELHDRMPVILDPADYDRWLDPAEPGGEALLRPCPTDWLKAVPVSTSVNNPRNQGPDLVQPVELGEDAAAESPPNSA